MHTNMIDPLLLLALILSAGIAAGLLFKKMHLPSVTGQLLAGVALAATGMHIFSSESIEGMTPVTHFALGLIAVAVGSHLHLRSLRNAYKRLLLMLLFEITLTPLLVFFVLRIFGRADWTLSMLLAALAISTAPATIVALVKETRAKGMFVKTLVATVAINNLACISVFELTHVIVGVSLDPSRSPSLVELVLAPLKALVFSSLLGLGIALLVILISRYFARNDQLGTISMIGILMGTGLANALDISALLTCMAMGVALVNLAPGRDKIGHGVFADFEYGIYAAFFTLAGLELNFAYLVPGGALALLVVIARMGGKILSGRFAMRLAHATKRTRNNLGLALVPQAGLAVGLILVLQDNPSFASLRDLFLAVGISSVTLNELIGPLLTRLALKRSGDYGKDRARLIDFLHEANIVTGMQANSKEQAIGKLVDLLISSHHLKIDRQKLLQSVLQREAEMSTCIGDGLAIPHGILESGDQMLGAMAVSAEGFDFPTPDGRPIHCMVLLATPEGKRDQHLKVLAALARAIGSDHNLQSRFYNARSPAHICELLHAEEASEDFNYFLDEELSPSELAANQAASS